jgi:hypothetical protein
MTDTKKTLSQQIAEELCLVQPIPTDTFQKLYNASTDRKDLIAEGYEPVSHIGLLWIKEINK